MNLFNRRLVSKYLTKYNQTNIPSLTEMNTMNLPLEKVFLPLLHGDLPVASATVVVSTTACIVLAAAVVVSAAACMVVELDGFPNNGGGCVVVLHAMSDA